MKQNIWALVILILFLLVVFYPILFSGKILLPLDQANTMTLPYSEQYDEVSAHNHFLFDSMTQFYPHKVFAREEALSGNFIYWNPYIFGGYPEYAYTHTTHFDITNIILFFCNMPMAHQLQIILQFLIAGFGMFVLLRFHRISAIVSLICATAYMLNSMFITTLLHRWILGSFCWVPYIILMTLYYREHRKVYYLVFSSIFLAFSFVGGSFQTSAYIILLLWVFYFSYFLSVDRQLGFFKSLLIPGLIFLLGFVLSAIMWIPSLEFFFLDIGSRASGVREYPILKRLLSIPLLTSFFIPELVGSVSAFDLTKVANACIFEFNGFIGFVPGLFGIWGVFFLWRKKPVVRPYIILSIIGLVIPLSTPLYRYLYHRFFIVYVFGVVVVGAVALEELIQGKGVSGNFKKWLKYPAVLFEGIFICIVSVNIIVSMNYDHFYLMAKRYIQANMYRGQMAAGNESWMLSRIGETFEHFSITSSTMFIPFLTITICFGLLLFYCQEKMGVTVLFSIVLLL